jgi:putative flippase GtrA
MIARQVLKYILAGSFTFLCEYASFIIFYQFIDNENIAHSLSYIVAMFVNFSLLRYWVFNKASTKFAQQAIGYLILVLINFFLSNGIMYALGVVDVNAYIAKAVTMCMIIIWNYAIMNRLIFKTK